MRGNPGFSFTNLRAKCEKALAKDVGLDPPGSFYEEALVYRGETEFVKLYDEKKDLLPDNQSHALRFASIDTNDETAILKFCSTYGPLCALSVFPTAHNFYIYEEVTRDTIYKKLASIYQSKGVQEREYVAVVKKEINTMKFLLDLDEAIRKRIIKRIVKAVLYICLDLTCLEFKMDNEFQSTRLTDAYQFRHALTIFATETGYHQYEQVSEVDVTKYVQEFIDVVDADKKIGSMGGKQRYPQSDCPTWFYLLTLLNELVQKTTIIIEPFGGVRFGKEFSNKEICQTITEVEIVKLGRAVFADVFKEHLQDVYPEIEFTDRGRSASWHIPSFLSAMYLELFFRLSPEGKFRRCADPKCNSFFEWSPSHPGKIYCSVECAQRVAKRMERERKKKMKGDSAT